MRPWQRNRLALVAAIFASVGTIVFSGFTNTQIISLIALYFLLFYLYVKFFNRYSKK